MLGAAGSWSFYVCFPRVMKINNQPKASIFTDFFCQRVSLIARFLFSRSVFCLTQTQRPQNL